LSRKRATVDVRVTTRSDFDDIVALTELVYPSSPPWTAKQLQSHHEIFPEGQLVAVERETDKIVGMAASLVILWDDYEVNATWREMTDHGMFTNHDPGGRTLYGAEIMVDPSVQGRGIGKAIYRARRDLARRLRVRRIRAGARLRGYHLYADRIGADEYVRRVVAGELTDPTLTFQLRQYFHPIAVVKDYLRYDPESLGYAALIEWINHDVAKRRDYQGRVIVGRDR